ncbi:YtxH domain-containing protein [Paenibacillus gansuensis]|uniref:YtxH domain-containing protein n=1 Tax=Paenibacillus gansuensis TaxID=306542 RepID=A0ABW5PBC8_9BACL
MSTQTKSGGGMMTGIIVGGLVGAAAGLLFAPKKGTELRQDLMSSCSTLNEKTSELTGTLGTKAKDLASNVGTQAGSVAGQASQMLSKAKELGQGAIEEYKTWRNEQKAADPFSGTGDTVLSSSSPSGKESSYSATSSATSTGSGYGSTSTSSTGTLDHNKSGNQSSK